MADGIINGTSKEFVSEHSDVALQDSARTERYFENETTGSDAFCAGYRGGLNAGEAQREATVTSTAALRGFKDGCDLATNAAIEPTRTELVKKARALGCIEPSEVEGYYIGFGTGFGASFASSSGATTRPL